jgi:hypothetical protein
MRKRPSDRQLEGTRLGVRHRCVPDALGTLPLWCAVPGPDAVLAGTKRPRYQLLFEHHRNLALIIFCNP